MNNKKLIPTAEVVGAILQTGANDLDLDKFKSSPSDFLHVETEIIIVENESSMVHLCLPYYGCMESTSLNVIIDTDLDSISADEIGVVLTDGAIGVTAVAASAVGIGVVAHENARQGKNLDGSPK